MLTTREEFISFQEFTQRKLAGGDSTVPLDELFAEWHDSRCRDEINEAIRRGLADIEARRFQSAEASLETIRQEFGFTKS